MGLSSSKQKTTTSGTTSQTGTTTPTNLPGVADAIMDFTGRIGSFSDADPNSFVAGASPLQQQAWGAASRLGLWGANNNSASNIALGAANAPSNLMNGSAGYTAARGNASTYTAPTLANPREATATGYTAGQAGPVNIGGMTNAQASNAGTASLLDNFSAYQSPYTRDVIDATMADFDQEAGQQRAALAARGARAGAFGGSRFGIAEGQLEGELARARATTGAGLRDQGFRTAAGLSQFDAGNRQQANLFNAQNQTGVSLANAAAQNQRALSQAGIDAQLGLANSDARNQAAQFGAGAQNNASQLNQGASNQFALTQAGMQTDAARYAADAANQFNQDYLGRADSAAQFGAASQNAANQFNAGQMEQGLARQLQAAGALNGFGNDYAANTQRDIALMSDLGGQQRAIEQQYALAPVAQLQTAGSLFGATPYQIFSGQNVQTNGTQQGTNVTKTSGSLFDQMLAAGQLASQFL